MGNRNVGMAHKFLISSRSHRAAGERQGSLGKHKHFQRRPEPHWMAPFIPQWDDLLTFP